MIKKTDRNVYLQHNNRPLYPPKFTLNYEERDLII